MIHPKTAYFTSYGVRLRTGVRNYVLFDRVKGGYLSVGAEIFMKKSKNNGAVRGSHTYKPQGIPEKFERVLELPVGALSGAVRMELSGNRRAVVDGCHGIIEYNDELIRLSTSSGIVRFTGRNLSISCLTDDNAVVEGVILSIEFLS